MHLKYMAHETNKKIMQSYTYNIQDLQKDYNKAIEWSRLPLVIIKRLAGPRFQREELYDEVPFCYPSTCNIPPPTHPPSHSSVKHMLL